MEPLEKLTAAEARMFDSARDLNPGDFCKKPDLRFRADFKYVLRFWNKNKQFLFDAFGQNLILSKKVKVTNIDTIEDNMLDLIKQYRDSLIQPVRMYFQDNKYHWSPSMWFNINPVEVLTEIERMKKNSWDYFDTLVLSNGEKIQGTCKLMKAWKKILNCMRLEHSPYWTSDLEEIFEKFRLDHSRALNIKDCETTLYLSIHPLDYITMSDNDCSWTSCMSWIEDGEYKQGTVEMMNSPYVILAYTCGNSPFNIYSGQWNNKNWRQNIIVHPDIISCCTEYPCRNPSLKIAAMEWVHEIFSKYYNYSAELVETSSQTCGEVHPIVRFKTNFMYNDFGCNRHLSYLADTFEEYEKIFYSGETECIRCGEQDIQETWHLYCDDCNPMNTYACACCGNLVPSTELNEEGYCYDCAREDEDEDDW